jgi:protease IV
VSKEVKRTRAIVIGLCVSLAVVILLLIIIRPFARPQVDKIAVIPLNGPITFESDSLLSGSAITPAAVREYLGRAEADRAVKAIVLRIESPGGGVPPCQVILEEIERVKEKMPVVVMMENLTASGGYYIATGADKIVAFPYALTGSIGVISQNVNIEGLYEKLGIKIETFKGGKYKDMYSGLREMTEEEKAIAQAMVDEYYEHFVDVVAEGRGLTRDQVRELATGQLYTGIEARRLGLVDELGGLDTAIGLAAELAGIEAPAVEYYRPPRITIWSLIGLGDAIRVRLWGLTAQDIILLETLNRTYPEPVFLYQG